MPRRPERAEALVSTARTLPPRTAVLHRRVRLIVAITITYNVAEAAIAIAAGMAASSAALIGFGLDSTVEVLSAAAIVWQFSAGHHADREEAAMRAIAVSFFALAGYVGFEAVRALLGDAEPAPSRVGIALAAASVLIMPTVSWLERRTGRELGSSSVVADSKQTLLCAWLSGVLLVGLALNATLGWSWADPIAALVIAAVAVREGREALRGETCCTPTSVLLTDEAADAGPASGCGDGCRRCHSRNGGI